MSLDGILDFRDKNYDDTTPIYTFWKQINVNGTWSQHPDTMYKLITSVPTISASTLEFMKKIGLGSLADIINTFQGLCQSFMYAYRIPSDADDTSVNMGLTGRIHKLKEALGDTSNNWLKTNVDFKSLFGTLKKYSYRPFLNLSRQNGTDNNETSEFADLLDPRSYYPLRSYLEDVYETETKAGRTPDLILPATWIFDYIQQKKFFPTISMPLNLNNVDLNVASNFLFGISNLVLFHENSTYVNEIFDDEMKQMYMNTLDLFIHSLKVNIVMERPDLAMLYYPSKFDFYWLVTRTYNLIKTERFKLSNNIKFKYKNTDDFFELVQTKLEHALKEVASPQILKTAETDGKNRFFTEFLGDYKNYSRYEDRDFATGLAFNSLINIWTDLNSDYHLEFSPDTPQEVKTLIDDLALFLVENINSYWTSLEGAFFSGSVKSYQSMPYFYPANMYEYLNGTKVPNHDDPKYLDMNYTGGVRGFIQKEEYEKLLNETYYGSKVPTTFPGFNFSPFPYWSSPAITHSISMIGLSKYKLIQLNRESKTMK